MNPTLEDFPHWMLQWNVSTVLFSWCGAFVMGKVLVPLGGTPLARVLYIAFLQRYVRTCAMHVLHKRSPVKVHFVYYLAYFAGGARGSDGGRYLILALALTCADAAFRDGKYAHTPQYHPDGELVDIILDGKLRVAEFWRSQAFPPRIIYVLRVSFVAVVTSPLHAWQGPASWVLVAVALYNLASGTADMLGGGATDEAGFRLCWRCYFSEFLKLEFPEEGI
jgi:hypothetical protein